MTEQFVFVYNTDGGSLSSIANFAHRLIRPVTYPCKLYDLTYGNLSMKNEWKLFVRTLPLSSVFLHRNEFKKKHKTNAALPAIFRQKRNSIELLVRKERIEGCQTLAQLMQLVSTKLHRE